MIALDSARWDTLTPKIMKIPLSIDMDTFAYCYAYEAYFDKPVTVDSTFYIGITSNSNETVNGLSIIYTHIPTFYINMPMIPCNGCVGYNPKIMFNDEWVDGFTLFHTNPDGYWFGGALPIVDMNDLETRVAGQGIGTVAGGGRYARGTYHDITAIPNPGYRFQRWNDGVTDSSRIVYLTQDTLFTAYFLENDMSEVRATSTNDTLGTVEGGGLYHQGVTVTLTARPADSCYFVMWTDSVLDNPRSFVLTHDTSFSAVFARLEIDISEGDTREAEEAKAKAEAERKALAAAQYHTIRQGDTLGKLAVRYHTSVRAICRLNKGLTERTVLQLGRKIRVK